jgi:O-methyltransferase involved in polyketide biosynthesis
MVSGYCEAMTAKWDWGQGSEPEQAPPGIDVTIPSQARIYDVLIGGKDNFAVDRAAAEVIIAGAPDAPPAALDNRAFLGRAVRYCVEQGIRQFLDIGTGLPTQGNVHEIALPLEPDAHIVYVDYDPIVLSHARALLAPTGGTSVIQADLRDTDGILAHPEVQRLIDFDQPVAVLLVAVLNFVTDEEARRAVHILRERMAPGSMLVISHVTADNDPERGAEAGKGWDKTGSGMHFRERADVERYFDGFELADPGLVWVAHWRAPDKAAALRAPRWAYAGVGRRTLIDFS